MSLQIIKQIILLKECKLGYKAWCKSRTISPLGTHLSHQHSLLAPGCIQYNDEIKYFADTVWNIHHNLKNIAILNEKSLLRCLISIVILLSKDFGSPKVHRIRLINTYESDYNLILKYFWPKYGIQLAKKNWLGYNQT